MPDQGHLTEARLPHAAPVTSPLYPALPWKLPGARVLKIAYETDVEPVLKWLPPKLTRSSPPYVIAVATHYPESPVGPFSVAAQYIGCRAGFFIRAFSVHAVTDSSAALSALREVWGFPAVLGEMGLGITADGATANVSVSGNLIARLELTSAADIAPDLVRFDPVLNLRVLPSLGPDKKHDLIQLAQIDPDYEVTVAKRGKGSVSFPEESPSPWSLLPPRSGISATLCTMNTELPHARFVIPY